MQGPRSLDVKDGVIGEIPQKIAIHCLHLDVHSTTQVITVKVMYGSNQPWVKWSLTLRKCVISYHLQNGDRPKTEITI